MENSIFNFVSPQSNDKLSAFCDSDQKRLFFLLDNFLTPLREKLNLPGDVTFGMELELENINDINRRYLSNGIMGINIDYERKFEWELSNDTTLVNGAEIVSPIFNDSIQTWESLNAVCRLAKLYGKIEERCGSHVHVGTQTIGAEVDSWLNLFKLWGVYENIIFRFAYGEFLSLFPGREKFCAPVGMAFLRNYLKFNNKIKKGKDVNVIEILSEFKSGSRNNAVNLKDVKIYSGFSWVEHKMTHKMIFSTEMESRNTIEFRCPNGTLNPIIWQNNINLFVMLLLYSKNLINFDDDIIQKRMIKIKNGECSKYNDIYVDQALELADLIFETNLDKICFLKQYLKTFQFYEGKEMKRAIGFTAINKK